MNRHDQFAISAGPFLFGSLTTSTEMWLVTATLFPVLFAGVNAYGWYAGAVALLSILSAVGTEALITGLAKKLSISDGSAFLTGLLVALAMPPRVPLFIPIIAAAFAIAVVKQSFGGLGCNWMNPALAGSAFAYLGWPDLMTNWVIPRAVTGVEGVAGATPFMALRESLQRAVTAGGPVETLRNAGMSMSGADAPITDAFNSMFSSFSVDIPKGYMDFLFGNAPGTIGQAGTAFVLMGSMVLMALGIIKWKTVASFFGSFAALSLVFGGLPYGTGLFTGDALFASLSGAFPLVALYMASDPVTSPVTGAGRMIYGALAGVLVFLLRSFGNVGDGAAFAVLVMNCFVPLLDRTVAEHANRRRVRE